MGGLRGSLWGPFWGLFGGLAGKTYSKAILEPFRGHSGGPVGGENDHFDWEGCIKSAFQPFRIGAHFESPAGPILGPIRGSKWCQNRSRSPPGADLENVLQKGRPQEPQMGPQTLPRPPQDPPKIPPIRAQEGPKRARKGVQNGSDSQLPSRTPSGPRLGPLWGPFWDHFGGHSGPIWGAILEPLPGAHTAESGATSRRQRPQGLSNISNVRLCGSEWGPAKV